MDDKLRDLLFRHAIAARSLGDGLAARIVGLLNDGDADLIDRIASRYAQIEADGFDRGPSTTERLEAMLEAIREVNQRVYTRVAQGFEAELQDIAQLEMDFSRSAIEDAHSIEISSPAPSTAFLKTLVTTTPLPFSDDGATLLMPWLATQEAGRLRRLEGALRLGILQGETTANLIKRIRGTRANGYTDGILQTSRKDAQTIALTANAAIQNAARQETYRQSKTIKYVEWSSILDSRTSTICQSRSGQVWAMDEAHPTPPAHPRCFPATTKVSTGNGTTTLNRIRGVSKRWFDGNLIIITCASGKRLSMTPNHPVLTRRGFIAAASLNTLDDVVSYANIERKTVIDDNHKNVETTIAEIADAFFASSQVATAKVPLTAKDFHGDARDGDIAIIGTNRELFDIIDTTLAQDIQQFTFDTTLVGLGFHSTDSVAALFIERNFATPHFGVGSGGKLLPILKTCSGHTGGLLLAPVSYVDASFFKGSLDNTGANTKHTGNLCNADASVVNLDGALDVKLFDIATNSNSGVDDEFSSSLCVDPILAGAILNGETGSIVFDKIIDIESKTFSGQVYNLETDNGYYHAEGIIVHNCRSLLLPRRDNTTPAKHKPFGQWLKEQPESVQDEILGKERADIFRQNPNWDFSKFFKENGSYRTLAELRVADAKIVKPKRVVPQTAKPTVKRDKPSKPEAAKAFDPINRDITAASVIVRSRAENAKALKARFAASAADPRHQTTPEFRGVKTTDFGKAVFGKDFTDEAASMITELSQEWDTITDAFNIPRIRSIKTSKGNHSAAMGEGVMFINPNSFNRFARSVSAKKLTADELATHSTLATRLAKLREELADHQNAALAGTMTPERETLWNSVASELFAKRALFNELDERLQMTQPLPVSTWKLGDPTKDRPANAVHYFDNLFDRARAIFYHELGHTVHQEYNKRGIRRREAPPPIEAELKERFSVLRRNEMPSKYATTDPYERFAENFSLYMMGRKDVVEPEMLELIDRLLREAHTQ